MHHFIGASPFSLRMCTRCESNRGKKDVRIVRSRGYYFFVSMMRGTFSSACGLDLSSVCPSSSNWHTYPYCSSTILYPKI